MTRWPHFEKDEIQAVEQVLYSGKVNYWTGEEGKFFEKEFAEFIGCRHAIAVANGTLALELALYALGVGSGDEVVTTSRTFMASASSIVMRGATPIFAEVDPVSQNITAETIAAVITEKTKAVIVVHLAGWPAEMDKIMALAEKHNVFVIEDCAQAHGAIYKGRMVGSWGHINAFSFCQDKIMTTGGEGGMVTTNDENLWKKAWAYKDHGKDYDTVFHKEHPPGFRWLHKSFGTNWRLTEMQSALGRVQLKKLPEWLNKRRHFADRLNKAFNQILAFRFTVPEKHCQHSYYKYYVFVRPDRLAQGWSRDKIMQAVVELGVPCFSGSCSEIYLEQCFVDAGLTPYARLPVAKNLGETSLMFLVHPTLTEQDIERTIDVVKQVMAQATAKMNEVSNAV